MSRSFRFQLALRSSAAVALGLFAISVATALTLAAVLDREIDATLLNIASIQAASLTDGVGSEMHFHDWELTPDEAASVRGLVSYAQVWQSDATSLLRSQYMTADLPMDDGDLDRAAGGEIVWGRQVYEGVPIRTLYYPLERLGEAHQRHVLQVASPIANRNDLLARVRVFMVVIFGLISGGTFGGAWWLAGRAVRPVHEIIDQAEEIGARSLDRRILAYADTREYKRLVEVLNTMLERIQQAFEAQRRFASDASHELRSPLTAMRGELELALRRPREIDEYRRVLNSTLEEVVRLSTITEDLLTLARSDSGAIMARREPTDVGEVVRGVVARLAQRATAKGIRFELDASGDANASLDRGLVGQAAWNLADNALKFTQSGGEITVRVVGQPDAVLLVVEDTGPGFGDEDPDRVFARFFRADPARSHSGETAGAGLGLAIARAAAEAHGGSAHADNRAVGGASVTLRFPRSES